MKKSNGNINSNLWGVTYYHLPGNLTAHFHFKYWFLLTFEDNIYLHYELILGYSLFCPEMSLAHLHEYG